MHPMVVFAILALWAALDLPFGGLAVPMFIYTKEVMA
jgi:hypothetical protein